MVNGGWRPLQKSGVQQSNCFRKEAVNQFGGQSAPICYVRPTSEMMILQGHHVSSNGGVRLPYLQDWKQGECDLVSLLQVMAATFGDLPPICMQPPPQPEQASCWLQFHRQTQVLHKADGRLYLSLCTEDGQHVVQENETNC
ncbi:uncharacterized protein zgc:123278 [Nerophis ophidion]|uniref:uncharacterized protein zgc:123278 n=1 Tax=Nerophis ophidion TaxID=159077 RepID=UPI002ADF7A0E|nr:uncharacterized protein zgc:123278 [Nerophis ophidion]